MYLENYIKTLKGQGLQGSVVSVSKEIEDNVNKHFNFKSNAIGLLFGQVQSGKTAQMLGAMARFADAGYKIFILLTSDNIDLQRQTYLRAEQSLLDFNVLSERDETKFGTDQSKPILLVLKKNSRVLCKWRNILLQSQYCKGKFLMIFDDEGDNASLNTLVNKNRISSINRHIAAIRDSASSSVYFEVTATPQSLLLQTTLSKWHPSFINYFKPGDGYKGGDFFYAYPKPFCIKYTAENELDDVTLDDDNICPQGLRESLAYFLVNCAHKEINGETNCNFMIHPSFRTSTHEKFTKRVVEQLDLLVESTSDSGFFTDFKKAWEDLKTTQPNIENFEDLKEKIIEILEATKIRIYTLNSKSFNGRDPNNPDALDLSKGFNIVVGGNTLGRGITFPHLQVVYYCRTSKAPQADTFWQHSRIFGYDREAHLVRIFLPQSLYKLFCELNKANSVLIKQIISRGLDGIEIIYPHGILPTRKNVLDNKYLNVVMGGINIFPNIPIENNTKKIDPLVEKYKNEQICTVDSNIIIEILNNSGSYFKGDFNSEKFINCIKALEEKRPKVKCKLLVRYNRDISRGTGTLLSPNDRLIADSYHDTVILILYRINGQVEKGWNGNPLWVPNIKFPDDCCFYDIDG